jgi:DNA polymerase III sliding clamp (beta) subunit (PCNA family)
MRVNREELIHSLSSLKPGIAKKEIIEQGDCVLFDAASGLAYSFNEQIACFIKLNLGVTGAVIAEPLLTLLGRLPDDEIDVNQGDDNLLIKCKRSSSGVKCDPQLRLPINVLERPDDDAWLPLPEHFVDAVGIVEGCVSTSDTDFKMSSIHIASDFMESANVNQACRYNIEMSIDEPFLVRHGVLRSIVSNGVSEYAVTSNWLHFRNKHDLTISCRRYVEEYIEEMDTVIAKKRDSTTITLPSGLKDAVATASLFSKDNLKGVDEVEVQFFKEKQKVFILGEGFYGFHRHSHKIEYDGEDLRFNINPRLFMTLIEQYKTCELCPECLKFSNSFYTYITSIEPPQ